MCGEDPFQDRLGAVEQEDEYVLDPDRAAVF